MFAQLRQLSMKVSKLKKLCKSEQGELDAVHHTLSVMHMPLGDLIEGYSCSKTNKFNEN